MSSPSRDQPLKRPELPVPRGGPLPRHQISLLGGFVLTVDGQIAKVPSSAQRVISLLALRGRCGRSRLAGSLWPENTEPRALASLRTTLWRANQVAPGLVESTHESVALAADVAVDVTRLVQAAHAVMEGRDAPRLDIPGLRYVEGDLLPDWTDDWLVVDRERLRQLRLHLLEALATWLADRGMFGMAMEAAQAALQADVLRESAHRAVIRVHLDEGNVAEAVHAFRECYEVLFRELGIVPSEETTALFRGVNPVREGPAMGASRTPHGLRLVGTGSADSAGLPVVGQASE